MHLLRHLKRLTPVLALALVLVFLLNANPAQARSTNFYPFPPVASDPDDVGNSWFAGMEAQCSSITVTVDAPTKTDTYNNADRIKWELLGVYDMDDILIPSDTGDIGLFYVGDVGTSKSATFNYNAPIAAGTRLYVKVRRTAYFHPMDTTGSPVEFDVGDFAHDDLYARAYDTAVSTDREYACAPVDVSTAPTVSIATSNYAVAEGNSGTSTQSVTLQLSAVSSEPVTARMRVDGKWNGTTTDNAMTFSTVEKNDFDVSAGIHVPDYRLDYPFNCTTGGAYCGLDPRKELQPPFFLDVTFAPGETSQSFDITINGDTTLEEDEYINVCLWETVNAQRDSICNGEIPYSDADMTITIADDDQANVVIGDDIIWDECLAPGVNQTINIPFTMDRTMPVSLNVAYATWNTTGNVVDGLDYEEVSFVMGSVGPTYAPVTMVSVPSGGLSGVLPVNFYGDTASEDVESVEVNMTLAYTASYITIIDGSRTEFNGPYNGGPGNILDGSVWITIPANGPNTTLTATATVAEGDSGQLMALIPITMGVSAQEEGAPAGTYRDVTFEYEVFIDAGDTATGQDILLGTSQVIIPAGQTTANIEVPVYGDGFDEDDETFSVRITGQNGACMLNDEATVTITDNDTYVAKPNTLIMDAFEDMVPLDLTFNWSHQPAANVTDVPAAPWYRLVINDGTQDVFSQWYNANDVCSSAACEIPFVDNYPYVLNDLTHTWTITSWNDGTQLTSDPAQFTVNIGAPTTPTVTDLTITYGQPAVTWVGEASAQWYRLEFVGVDNMPAYGKWFKRDDVCTDGTCYVDTMTVIQDGDYNAIVSAYGPANFFGDGAPTVGVSYPFTVENGSTDPVDTINLTNAEYGEPDISVAQLGGVDWYRVIITADGADTPRYSKWFPAADICADSTCTIDTGIYLNGGDYTLSMQTYGPLGWNLGDSAYTTDQAFSVINTAPATPTDLMTVNADTGEPRLTWTGDANATWYQVWLGTTEGLQMRYFKWSAALDLSCLGGIYCTLNVPDTYLSNGDYSWFVRAYGPAGMTGWAGTTFTVNAPVMTAPELESPVDVMLTPGGSPYFTFDQIEGATWVQLTVEVTDGDQLLQKWYSREQVICSSGTCFIWPGEDLNLTPNPYTWTLKAYSPAGVGPSSSASFTVVEPS